MEGRLLRRLTVDKDPAAFPCKQCFIDESGKLWWDLDYFIIELRKAGERRKRSKWHQRVAELASMSPVVSHGFLHKGASVKAANDAIKATLISTEGLISYCANGADHSRDTLGDMLVSHLISMCVRCVSELPNTDKIPGLDLLITCRGQVSGLIDLLARLHLSVAKSWAQDWGELRAHGQINSSLEAPHFADLMKFVVTSHRYRRSLARAVTPKLQALRNDLLAGLLRWLATSLNKYVLNQYSAQHDVNVDPPSKKVGKSGQRHYTRVEPDSIWSVMEDATRAGVSVRQAIVVKTKDLGCCEGTAEYWIRKYQHMYTARAQLTFCSAVHINIVADAATHSGKDIFAAVAFSWEFNAGAYVNIQHLLPGLFGCKTLCDDVFPCFV